MVGGIHSHEIADIPDLQGQLNEVSANINALQSADGTYAALIEAQSQDMRALESDVEYLLNTPGVPSNAGSSHVVMAADHGVSASNSGKANGDALRAIMKRFAGQHICLPVGIIEIDAVKGSSWADWPLRGGDYACFWMTSDTTLEIPRGCVLKFMGSAGAGPTAQGVAVPVAHGVHRLISNKNMDGTTPDKHMAIIGGGVVDCNNTLVYQGTSDINRIVDGIDFWQASDITVDGITVLNAHGENGSSGENFSFDFIRCMDVYVSNCRAVRTTGKCATGFHFVYVLNGHFTNCVVQGMNVQGFSIFGSRGITITGSRASQNKRGFNFEYSWDVTLVGCVAGGTAPQYPKNTTSTVNNPSFTDGQNFGNTEAGVHILFGGSTGGCGGGNYRFQGCHISGQTSTNARGVGLTGTHTFIPSSIGVNTVVAPSSSSLSRALVGGYMQMVPQDGSGISSTRPIVRIVGVSGTTITTDTPHGGVLGDRFIYFPGEITFTDCNIVNNYRGVQFLSPYGHPISRSTAFFHCNITNNIHNAIQDVASNTVYTSSLANVSRGQDVTDKVAWQANIATMNPLPFDIIAYTAASLIEVGDKLTPPTDLTPIPATGSVFIPAGSWFSLNGSTRFMIA